jgi:hypothetical protein
MRISQNEKSIVFQSQINTFIQKNRFVSIRDNIKSVA